MKTNKKHPAAKPSANDIDRVLPLKLTIDVAGVGVRRTVGVAGVRRVARRVRSRRRVAVGRRVRGGRGRRRRRRSVRVSRVHRRVGAIGVSVSCGVGVGSVAASHTESAEAENGRKDYLFHLRNFSCLL